MKIKAHFVTRDGALPSGSVTAICGAVVKKPKIADVLEPGTDTQLVVGKYDCSKCVRTQALQIIHHFYRVVEGST